MQLEVRLLVLEDRNGDDTVRWVAASDPQALWLALQQVAESGDVVLLTELVQR
jgi:hypothetical protein